MTSQGLKSLDRVVGPWMPGLVHVLNPVLGIRSYLKPGRNADSSPLIVRPGGLGDLVCLQMAIENLGLDIRRFRFIIERRSEPWAALHDLNYLSYDSLDLRALLREIGTNPLVVCTEQRFGLALAFAEVCRAPSGRLYAFDTCRGVCSSGAVRAAYNPRKPHEVEAFEGLLRQAFPEQVVTEDVAFAPRKRTTLTDGSLVACLSGGGQSSRTFRPDQWIKFIDAWAGQRLVRLTAAPADWETANAIVRRRTSPTEICGGAFAAVVDAVKGAEAIFTVDGGMTHVASYYGVPATVLFTSGQVVKWGPLAEGSRVVAVEGLSCRPCALFGQVPPCPHSFACKDIPELDSHINTQQV